MSAAAQLAPALPEPARCRLFVWDYSRPHAPPTSTGLAVFIAHCGIEGLARIDGDHLHLQDVFSAGPGSFRRFVEQAKAEFGAITAWNIWGHIARDALLRYDFEASRGRDADGKPMAGLTWSRARQAEITRARERSPDARWTPMTDPQIAAGKEALARALNAVSANRQGR